MKRNYFQFLLLLFVIPVSIAPFFMINAQFLNDSVNQTDLPKPRISSIVYSEMNKSNWISVGIFVKSTESVEAVLSELDKSEFQIGKVKSDYQQILFGNISRSGLEKLKNSKRIDRIHGNTLVGQGNLYESVGVIKANNTWILNYSGQGQTICLIDTGINWDHESLGGCFGLGCKVLGGRNILNTNNISKDDNGHGTLAAGVISSTSSTWKGVAPNTTLVSLKVCDEDAICPDLENDLPAAIEWCIANRSIYNISIITIISSDKTAGYSAVNCPEDIQLDVENATRYNISVVISSGNKGFQGVQWPGCTSGAISVGATYDDSLGRWPLSGTYLSDTGDDQFADCYDNPADKDKITCYTSRSNNLDLLAPGSKITSTNLVGEFSSADGTSFAAPHVAGTIALLLEKNSGLTPAEIEAYLKNTSDNIQDSTVTHNTYKRINALEAINEVCGCSAWVFTGCGGGICQSSEGRFIRNCTGLSCGANAGEDCRPNATCVTSSGGTIRNVCKSGCSYLTIQSALNAVTGPDLINITDNATYQENIVWPQIPAGGITLDCRGANITGTGSSKGIYINNSDDNTIRYCNIMGFGRGIQLNSTSGENKIKYNNITGNIHGIYFEDSVQLSNYISYNNISNNNASGIFFEGDSQSVSAQSNIIQNNIIRGNKDYGIWFKWGVSNTIRYNTISNQTYGIYLEHGISNGFTNTAGNSIYGNLYGMYFKESETNTLSNNTFCSVNTVYDVHLDASRYNTGDLNKCESPSNWSDDGTTGCTYLCNYAPNVTLGSPSNGSVIYDSNITLTCAAYDLDDFNLSNATLYHNIAGTWQVNQTANLSGLSDSATFTINNVSNGTYQWNCKVYDQDYYNSTAKPDWGDYNYTFNVSTAVLFSITGFKEIYSSGTKKVFEFWINNPRADALNNISWSLRTGDNTTINSTLDFGLNGNDNALVIVEYNYSSSGTYNASLNVSANGINKTASILVSPGSNLLVLNLSVINSTARNRTFEFKIKNQLAINMSAVRWNMTLGNGRSINATQSIDLSPYEEMSVFVEYNYSSASTYTVNATARNGTNIQSIISSKNISVTVT